MLTELFGQVLFFLYHLLGNNLGLAIIALTLILKFLLFPVTLKSLKAAEKLKKIQPELNRLKKKHKDVKKLQQAQIELFKKHKVNPMASFIPQVVQIAVIIILYQLLIRFLNTGEVDGQVINTGFLWLDLTKPDQLYILPVLAGLSQFGLSYLMQKKNPSSNLKLKKEKTTKKTEEGMMEGLSKSMLYVFPFITVFFATKFPSGLVVYWVVSNLFSLVQQYYFVKSKASKGDLYESKKVRKFS